MNKEIFNLTCRQRIMLFKVDFFFQHPICRKAYNCKVQGLFRVWINSHIINYISGHKENDRSVNGIMGMIRIMSLNSKYIYANVFIFLEGCPWFILI